MYDSHLRPSLMTLGTDHFKPPVDRVITMHAFDWGLAAQVPSTLPLSETKIYNI